MYDPPGYLWAIIIVGVAAIAASTCVVLYAGAERAGLGDIATAFAAPLAARKLAQGTGRRAGLWFNAFGLTDLVLALTLGGLTAFGLLHITPSSAPILGLPLALVPTVGVPLLFALYIKSLATPTRSPRPAPSVAGSPAAGDPAGALIA